MSENQILPQRDSAVKPDSWVRILPWQRKPLPLVDCVTVASQNVSEVSYASQTTFRKDRVERESCERSSERTTTRRIAIPASALHPSLERKSTTFKFQGVCPGGIPGVFESKSSVSYARLRSASRRELLAVIPWMTARDTSFRGLEPQSADFRESTAVPAECARWGRVGFTISD